VANFHRRPESTVWLIQQTIGSPSLDPVSERLSSPSLLACTWHFQRNNRRDKENAKSGVAIYQNLQSATTFRPLAVTVDDPIRCTKNILGDVCFVEVTVHSRIKLVLGTVCVHPGRSHRDTPPSSSSTVCVHPGISQRDTNLFLWHGVCSSRHILVRHLFLWHRVCSSRHIPTRHSPLPLAPCVFIQAQHSETLTSSSGYVCVRPGTPQRDTHLFLWHRMFSSRHTTARHSPLPLSAPATTSNHST
jgi:hypothetical protein